MDQEVVVNAFLIIGYRQVLLLLYIEAFKFDIHFYVFLIGCVFHYFDDFDDSFFNIDLLNIFG